MRPDWNLEGAESRGWGVGGWGGACGSVVSGGHWCLSTPMGMSQKCYSPHFSVQFAQLNQNVLHAKINVAIVEPNSAS